MCCKMRDTLVAVQKEQVARLEAELAEYVAQGDEYYADIVQKELVRARCAARLIHAHKNPHKETRP